MMRYILPFTVVASFAAVAALGIEAYHSQPSSDAVACGSTKPKPKPEDEKKPKPKPKPKPPAS